jgi:hypothetical protein
MDQDSGTGTCLKHFLLLSVFHIIDTLIFLDILERKIKQQLISDMKKFHGILFRVPGSGYRVIFFEIVCVSAICTSTSQLVSLLLKSNSVVLSDKKYAQYATGLSDLERTGFIPCYNWFSGTSLLLLFAGPYKV